LDQASISLSEVISALSFALDLTEGAVPGHALRSCLLGMRIAAAAGVSADEQVSLYYALLLKDTGCSSNAARMCQIVGGDDRAVKSGAKLEDWTKPHRPRISTLRLLWNEVLPNASPLRKAARILKIGATQHANNQEMITMRCERGAKIVTKLGMGPLAAETVRYLDEHWDGSGYPSSLKGSQIPLLARICAIAQHLDVFSTERSIAQAINVLIERSGAWFDPDLVALTVSLNRQGTLWANCLAGDSIEDTRHAVLDLDSAKGQQIESGRIDQICEAFADVVDAKSPFTFRHSVGVADVAYDIAVEMGLPTERVQLVRRAALLHDIGKLGISNSILDKPCNLNAHERSLVEEHPSLTRRILERVTAFHELAIVAGEHHEKLDGSGYPHNLTAKDLSIESRIIAVADVFGALHEDRPYRLGIGLETIITIMQDLAPHQLDPACTAALFATLQQRKPELAIVSRSTVSGTRSVLPAPVAASAYISSSRTA
jgi:putative nucleotidyltransferase with HDIG domain